MSISLAQLLIQETKAAIYTRALSIATAVGLPVTSWRVGDPTRSTYHVLSEILSTAEEIVAGYIGAGFLDYATGEWLILLADQVYDVQANTASYATCLATLTNPTGAIYSFDVGDVTITNGVMTYHNTTAGNLAALGTLSLEFVADEPGSDGTETTIGIGGIDTMVTVFGTVTVANTTIAVGNDAEEDEPLRVRCRAKLGALSPNGPKDAYNYVATSTSPSVTRSRTFGDTTNGTVSVYLASAAGAVDSTTVDLVEAAILESANPICATVSVDSATEAPIAIDYDLWLYDSVGETVPNIESAVAKALTSLFSSRPIGGDIISPAAGKIYMSTIARTIEAVYPKHAFRVVLNSPASDTALALTQVATIGGAIGHHVHLVPA